MSAVAKIKQEETAVATMPARNDSDAMFSLIERISTDPSVSIDRVEQAFDFYQKVQADQARKSFDAAFAAMQPELPAISKKGKSHNGKYALWEDIVEAINPIIAKHGFALSFRTANEPGKIRITAVLSHRDGHREETSYDLPADKTGSKNDIQAIGSTTSYGKRYLACSLLNIVARGEDDDGNAAGGLTQITAEQVKELEALIEQAGSNRAAFLKIANAETLSDVLAKDLPGLKKVLLAKKNNGEAK